MHNPIRRLRAALGLSQADLGRLVGRSYQSIQNYERGIPMPKDVVEKLKALASERGFPDLAIELSEKRQVPASTERGLEKPPARNAAITPVPNPDERGYYHSLLDEVFNSGDRDAIEAVTKNIELFAKYVRQISTPRGRARRTGTTRGDL